MVEKQDCIAFGYYDKEGKLIGFYADAFGSIRKHPKIYGFSESQIDVIINNVNNKIKRLQAGKQSPAIDAIASVNSTTAALMGAGMNADDKKLTDMREFELRIHKSLISNATNGWYYPSEEEMEEWLANLPEAFRTYKFKI